MNRNTFVTTKASELTKVITLMNRVNDITKKRAKALRQLNRCKVGSLKHAEALLDLQGIVESTSKEQKDTLCYMKKITPKALREMRKK